MPERKSSFPGTFYASESSHYQRYYIISEPNGALEVTETSHLSLEMKRLKPEKEQNFFQNVRAGEWERHPGPGLAWPPHSCHPLAPYGWQGSKIDFALLEHFPKSQGAPTFWYLDKISRKQKWAWPNRIFLTTQQKLAELILYSAFF